MKSFIIHIDSLEILESLNNEQAGKLFKAIKQYQEDQTIIEEDQLIKVALSPFISQFKRDKEKYDNICKRNRENGKNGGRPKTEETQNNPVGYLETQENPKNLKNKNKNKSKNDSNSNNKLIVQNENHFEQFWQQYTPIETSIGSKAKAKKKYQEYLKKYTHDKILEATHRYIDHCKKNKQKTKMCYGFFDEHLESYINQKEPIDKEEDKIQKLKAINQIAGQKLFSSPRQLQANNTAVFLFMKNDDDEQALRNLPESKRNQIKDILKDMLENKELKIQIANFHI